jgi:hypothetical protein
MKRHGLLVLAAAGFAALLYQTYPARLSAQVAPTLGRAAEFGALGAASVVGSAAPGTVVNGDVGSYPTPAVSNFPPSSTVPPFTVHRAADGVVQQAQADARTAYNFLAGQGGAALPIPPAADQLSGRTITAGVYALGAGDLAASTTLTLSGPGIFIFNVSSTLTMNVSSIVTGSANPCNVFWRVGTSATLNGSSFMGTVIADASVTVGAGNVTGRVIALTGSVTMPTGGNTIGGCSTAPAVVCPVITLAPLATPNGTVGVAYSQPITASGGAPPHTFAVTTGALPPGLTLTPAGLISGTPTAAGTFTFSISGIDTNGCSGTLSYTIVVAAAPPPPPVCPIITLSPTVAPNGTAGVAYTQTFVATGGLAPYSFGTTAGALPAGLTLTAAGVLAGTPTAAGTYTFTIRATDANGCFVSLAYTIVITAAGVPPPPVCPVVTFSPATLPNATVGVFYTQTLTGSGGTGPYVFTGVGGAFPPGIGLSTPTVLSGTPTVAGTSNFALRVTDANGCFADRPFTVITIAAVPTLPQAFVVLLALGLTGVGYVRLRRQARR